MKNYTNNTNFINFVKSSSNDIKDVHGDEPSGSFYSYYIHKQFNLPIEMDYEPSYTDKIDDIYKLQNLNFDLDGIYSFLTESPTELNYFIIIIDGDNLKLLSVYGGQQGIIEINTDKHVWLNSLKTLYLLNNVNDNKIQLYKELFGIKKVYFDDLNLDSFSFNYSYKNI